MRRLAAAIGTLVFLTACSAPPQKEIDRAQGAIDAARAAGAEQYASEPFTAATTAMQQTHEAVQQRDYRLALSRAVDANERALEAARQAANGKAKAQAAAEAAVLRTQTSIRQLAEQLKAAEAARVPVKELESPRRLLTEAQRALQEARTAIVATNYPVVMNLVKDVPDRIVAEMRGLTQAIDARTARGRPRRR